MQTTSSACKLLGTATRSQAHPHTPRCFILLQVTLHREPALLHSQKHTTAHGMTRRTQKNSRRQRQSCRACRGLHSGRQHVRGGARGISRFMPRAASDGAAVRAKARQSGGRVAGAEEWVGGRTGADCFEAVALEEGHVGVQVLELLGAGGSDKKELPHGHGKPHESAHGRHASAGACSMPRPRTVSSRPPPGTRPLASKPVLPRP